MAGISKSFVAALYRYGAESAGNKTQLQTWKSEALTAIAENKGGSPISGSANGVSFALGGDGSMSISEWFRALDAALIYVEKGVPPSSTAFIRVI